MIIGKLIEWVDSHNGECLTFWSCGHVLIWFNEISSHPHILFARKMMAYIYIFVYTLPFILEKNELKLFSLGEFHSIL